MNDTKERYDRIKTGVLGSLPERLHDLIHRLDDVDDIVLLLQVAERLDVLAGGYAYTAITEEPT